MDMVKSKFPTYYENWGNKKALVKLSVSTAVQEKEGVTYTIVYSAIYEEGDLQIGTKAVFKSNEEIDLLNAYLENTNTYPDLPKSELDWLKIRDALFLDVTTNLYEDGKTVFRLTPEDWELC